ncbi:hypothetical protein GJ496_003413 [Pomphorhynchus laevis]|nr:hypothetical protein GJ496_003413 [Pomphorhynchus laevis]
MLTSELSKECETMLDFPSFSKVKIMESDASLSDYEDFDLMMSRKEFEQREKQIETSTVRKAIDLAKRDASKVSREFVFNTNLVEESLKSGEKLAQSYINNKNNKRLVIPEIPMEKCNAMEHVDLAIVCLTQKTDQSS